MASTRSATRQRSLERRAATERTILDAFEKLLVDRPFRDVVVEDVMGVAGLTRTAFYRYFPDLETVLLNLMGEVAAALGEASGHWLEGDDHLATMQSSAHALALVYESRGRLLLAFTDAAGSGLDIDRAWRQAVEAFVVNAGDRVSRLQERGLVQLVNPLETARALVWMTERYLLEAFGHRAGDKVTVDDAADVLVTIWRRTLFSPS